MVNDDSAHRDKNESTNYDRDEPPQIIAQDVTCRICFEDGPLDSSLISPCDCSGTQRYVHVDCLVQVIVFF